MEDTSTVSCHCGVRVFINLLFSGIKQNTTLLNTKTRCINLLTSLVFIALKFICKA